MMVMLILIAVAWTKPITLTGLAIALCTIPFIFMFVFSIIYRWHKRFGGSKFMNLVAMVLLFSLVATSHFVALAVTPFIGEHFCQSKRHVISECYSGK